MDTTAKALELLGKLEHLASTIPTPPPGTPIEHPTLVELLDLMWRHRRPLRELQEDRLPVQVWDHARNVQAFHRGVAQSRIAEYPLTPLVSALLVGLNSRHDFTWPAWAEAVRTSSDGPWHAPFVALLHQLHAGHSDKGYQPNRSTIGAIAKALEILEDNVDGPLSPRGIGKQAKLSTATLYRALPYMRERGYLTIDNRLTKVGRRLAGGSARRRRSHEKR